jgi:hypothetical protein
VSPPPSRSSSSSSGNYSYSNYGSDKSWGILVVLSISLGWLGADRFYAGRWGLGVLKILSMLVGVGAIWYAIDVLLAITGKQEDDCGDYISGGRTSGCISKLLGTAIIAAIAIVVIFNVVPDARSTLEEVADKAKTAFYELTGKEPPPPASIVGKNAIVTAKSHVMRAGPSATSKNVKILKQGDALVVIGVIGAPPNDWVHVKHGNIAGYVSPSSIVVKK